MGSAEHRLHFYPKQYEIKNDLGRCDSEWKMTRPPDQTKKFNCL